VGGTAVNVAMDRPDSTEDDCDPAWSRASAAAGAAGAAGTTVGVGVPLRASAVAIFFTTYGWPGSGVTTGIGVGVPFLRASAVAIFSTTYGWPGSGVTTGIGVGLAVGGIGVGIAAEPPHAVSSNIRAVDSTSNFMDISFTSTHPPLYLIPMGLIAVRFWPSTHIDLPLWAV